MTSSDASDSILNALPEDDQGSEATYGFDYQAHCASRLCLEMICSHEIQETVCEYHEDVAQLLNGHFLRFCQVKKRETATAFTLALVKEALLKLLTKVKYKDVGELVIFSHGRPSDKGDYSMAGLITLLDRPKSERDGSWDVALAPYENELAKLLGSKIDADTIHIGLRLLRIDLTMPHPEAIEAKNCELVATTAQLIWAVSVSVPVAHKMYNALYNRVWDASTKPKQPRSVKQITEKEARDILRQVLRQEGLLTDSPQMLLDINAKLTKGQLDKHLSYALEQRMDARQIKFELDLGTTEWQDLRDEVAISWGEFRIANSGLSGNRLWQELRSLLKRLGESWSGTRNNCMDSAFAEGLFFDMMAVCEADLGS